MGCVPDPVEAEADQRAWCSVAGLSPGLLRNCVSSTCVSGGGTPPPVSQNSGVDSEGV